MTVRLAHIGIAVRSIAEARNFYEEVLGLDVDSIEEIASEGVRVAMLPFPGGQVELLEPTAEDSPVGRFLEKRGEGLHHVSFDVPDVRGTIMAAIEHGVETVGDAPRTGAEGREIAFFHPLFTHGVLVEVCGPRPGAGSEDVVAELRDLGRRLGAVLQRAWSAEERRRLEEDVRTGLRSFADEVENAFRQARESLPASRVETEARDAARRLRGGVAESLTWLSDGLGALAERLRSPDGEGAEEANGGEPG